MNIALKHLSVALILACGLAWVRPAYAQENATAPAQAGPALFAILYRPGPGWKAGLPMQKQALREHAQYYQTALRQGRVFAGGALAKIDGGLAILRMSSLDEAEAFLAADPALLNGTFVGEVHAWTPRFVADGPLKP
ncbi:MAG: hypothetical protein H0W74_07085 [Sphingosinicella sp.]|nr:hypothetical protein [Sphingosinicella sp.]